MTGIMRPWQNRPSLISYHEHTIYAQDLTGAPINELNFQTDNILLIQVPQCIPRACRLVRICLLYAYLSSSGEDFEFRIFRSSDCGSTYNPTIYVIQSGTDGLVNNCLCIDAFNEFDKCDVWYAQMILPGTTFPIFRGVLGFDLR